MIVVPTDLPVEAHFDRHIMPVCPALLGSRKKFCPVIGNEIDVKTLSELMTRNVLDAITVSDGGPDLVPVCISTNLVVCLLSFQGAPPVASYRVLTFVDHPLKKFHAYSGKLYSCHGFPPLSEFS
jgi:hypothetical protein